MARTLRQFRGSRNAVMNSRDEFLPFDAASVMKRIEKASVDVFGRPLFCYGQIRDGAGHSALPLLWVDTDYPHARKTVDVLSECLDEGVSVFDLEMDCRNAIAGIHPGERREMISLRLLHEEYCLKLRRLFGAVGTDASVFKLGECFCFHEFSRIHSVIDTSVSILDESIEVASLTGEVYSVLSEAAEKNGERVDCRNGCFMVENDS